MIWASFSFRLCAKLTHVKGHAHESSESIVVNLRGEWLHTAVTTTDQSLTLKASYTYPLMTIAVKSLSHLIIAFLAPFRERVDALLAGGLFFW